MTRLKISIVVCLLSMGTNSFAQDLQTQTNHPPKLIAVVNRANWCTVCKANGQRFGGILASYADKGIVVYMNDLTNDSTREASKKELQDVGVYDAVTTCPRKGIGKDKKESTQASGVVTFIDPSTHKQLKQQSIAASDAEMKSLIDGLLNK